MATKLEDLIAQDLVRYFPIAQIPAGKDVQATKEKYGFIAAYDFMNRAGTVFYNKQTAIDAGLTPEPNGTIPSGIVWEEFPPPVTDTYKADLIWLRDLDLSGVNSITPEQGAKLAKITQTLLKILPETKDLS